MFLPGLCFAINEHKSFISVDIIFVNWLLKFSSKHSFMIQFLLYARRAGHCLTTWQYVFTRYDEAVLTSNLVSNCEHESCFWRSLWCVQKGKRGYLTWYAPLSWVASLNLYFIPSVLPDRGGRSISGLYW